MWSETKHASGTSCVAYARYHQLVRYDYPGYIQRPNVREVSRILRCAHVSCFPATYYVHKVHTYRTCTDNARRGDHVRHARFQRRSFICRQLCPCSSQFCQERLGGDGGRSPANKSCTSVPERVTFQPETRLFDEGGVSLLSFDRQYPSGKESVDGMMRGDPCPFPSYRACLGRAAICLSVPDNGRSPPLAGSGTTRWLRNHVYRAACD